MMKSTKFLMTIALSTSALTAISSPIYAQDSTGPVLDEIITTAQKKPERLQDVPISVSAVSGEKIASAGIQDLEDAVAYTPNVIVNQQSIGYNINIRGIQSGNQAGFEQSVGTFVDGVYRGRGVQSRFAFLDVGSLEILRGPQGTLFGKNVVAGALNIRSARPTDELTGKIGVSYNPEFEETEVKGFVSGPLSDTVRARGAFLHRQMDEGWINNTVYDQGEPRTDEQAIRGIIDWDASANTTVSVKAEYGQWDNAGRPFEHIVAGPLAALGVEGDLDGNNTHGSVQAGSPLNALFPTDSVQEVGSSVDFSGETLEGAITVTHDLDAGTITGIASYSEYDFVRLLDADYAPADIASFHETEDFDQVSLEVRFESDSSERFSYLVGGFYNDNNLTSGGLSLFSLTTIGGILGQTCLGTGGQLSAFNPATDDALTTIFTNTEVNRLSGTSAATANACSQASVILPVVGSGLLANADGVSGVSRYARLDQNTETFALFGQATYDLTEDWRVTGGLRYTDETKTGRHVTYAGEYLRTPTPVDTASPIGQLSQALAGLAGEFVPFDTGEQALEDESLTWSVNTQWDATDDIMLYASASTGFKSGGFNTFYFSLNPNSDDVSFEDEEVISFEVGSKMTLADGRAELNIAAFKTEYDNLQVSIFSGNTTFEVQNAAQAETQGIEIDGRLQANENVLITAGLGFTDFEYTSFPNQACTDTQFVAFRESVFSDPNNVFTGLGLPAGAAAILANNGLCAQAGINDLQGRTSSQTPEVSGLFSINYKDDISENLELSASLDLIYRSQVYRQDDLDPLMLDPAATTINGSVTLGSIGQGWEIGLIGRNLTDVQAFDFGNDVPLASGSHFVGVSPPRSYAVTFSYDF